MRKSRIEHFLRLRFAPAEMRGRGSVGQARGFRVEMPEGRRASPERYRDASFGLPRCLGRCSERDAFVPGVPAFVGALCVRGVAQGVAEDVREAWP